MTFNPQQAERKAGHPSSSPFGPREGHPDPVRSIDAAATLLTILALDYASIQRPTGGDALAWPLLD